MRFLPGKRRIRPASGSSRGARGGDPFKGGGDEHERSVLVGLDRVDSKQKESPEKQVELFCDIAYEARDSRIVLGKDELREIDYGRRRKKAWSFRFRWGYQQRFHNDGVVG